MARPRLDVQRYRLRLRPPWVFGGRRLTHREGWLVRLTLDGHVGYGEAAPLPGYAGEPMGRVPAALAAYAHAVAEAYRFYSYGDACLLYPHEGALR